MIPDASFSTVAAALENADIKRGRFPGVCFECAILREIADQLDEKQFVVPGSSHRSC